MKTKAIAALVLASVVVLGVVASSAGAGRGRITSLTALLTLRPGVSRSAHHPVASEVYGQLDGTFNSARSRVAYSLYYQGLNGFGLDRRSSSCSAGSRPPTGRFSSSAPRAPRSPIRTRRSSRTATAGWSRHCRR